MFAVPNLLAARSSAGWPAMRAAAAGTLEAFASLIYPAACVQCSASVDSGEYLCGACSKEAERIEPPFCATCSEPFAGAIDDPFSCQNCRRRKFAFTLRGQCVPRAWAGARVDPSLQV